MWNLTIRNIGGIRTANATLDAGLNVVQASNFMGKSSFMRALQTAMGTSGMFDEGHPLTEGATEGSVRLETADGDYEVELARTSSNGITRRGTPVLEDETDRTCARLFAFLGENNPIRARVREQRDLTELLQAPLDIEDLDSQIATRKRERESKRERLDRAEQAERNIPSVREAIDTLETEVERLRERRDEVAARGGDEAADGESLSDDLAEKRSTLATLDQRISGLEEQISRTEARIDEQRAALAELDVPDEPEPTADVEATESRIADCELKIDLLEGLHRANQRVIEENEVSLVTSVDRNVVGDEFDCWVCGETTTDDAIEARLSAMQDEITALREEKESLTAELDAIEAKQRRYREKQREKADIEAAIGDCRAELDDLEGDLRQARERRSALADEIAALEAEVTEAETDLSEELTDLKAELRTKEQELETQQDRLAELRERKEEAETLRADIDALDEDIERLRNRKTETQWELKDEFDAAMAAAIDRFAPGFDGARLDVKTTPDNEIEAFELVIARDGRETTIDNLSEGERELVGIVVAVAGYRTYDVAERVPLILLDGISQLSADNLRSLSEFLASSTDILVTTAYPEAGSFGGHHISPEDWDTVSDEEATPA